MGGSSKSQTVGYRYYMGLHFGLCHGPVDEVNQVKAGDREAWIGVATENTTISISKGELFGGDKKEGGLSGSLDIQMGGPTQGQNGYLASKISAAIPAFRGILSAVWRGGQVSANNPYIKPWAFRVQRILQGWDGGSAWNPTKAKIGIGTGDFVEVFNNLVLRINLPVSPPVDSGPLERPITVSPAVVYGVNEFGAFYDFRHNPGTLRTEFATVDIPNSLWLADIGESFLIRLRVFLVSYAGGTIMDQYADPYSNFFWIGVNSTGKIQILQGGWGALIYPSTNSIPLNQWTVVELKRVGSTLTLSIGGVVSDSITYTGRLGTDQAGIRLGDRVGYPPAIRSSIDGMVADVLINKGDAGSLVEEFPYSAMNPAHIVYECLTNSAWGMGYPTSAIDATSFTASANSLFGEDFGLCLVWNRQETIDRFIQTVLDHAGGILYVDPATGRFALKLIRGDYDRNTLPQFGPSNLISASDYQRQAWGETINEVTVVYRDFQTNKDAAVTIQDLANIQTQGAVVSQTRQYPGLPVAGLAQRVAMRDLNAVATPLAKVRLAATRAAWALTPGDVFRLTWPDYGVDDVVFRVLEINRGTLQDGTIQIEAVEDVFGLPSNTYIVEQTGGWIEPSNEPAPAPYRKLVEAPYWDLALTLTAADLDYLDPLSGYVQALAARPTGDSLNYEINSKVGGAEYQERATAQFCPTATITAAINKTATAITFENRVDVDLVSTGAYGYIDDEVVGITAIDADAGTATITRGLLDTVPADHAAGARIWFADGYQGVDETEYATGEVVDVKLLPRTGRGELAIDAAPSNSITMARRQNRPYAPGNFRINGTQYPAEIIGPITLTATWAHRDRLTQTAYLVQQSEGNIGPEAGTTYTAQLWNHATNTMIAQFTGITGTSQAFSAPAAGVYSLRMDVWSVRDSLASHQKQSHVFTYIDVNLLGTDASDYIAAETGDRIQLEQ